MMADQSTKEGPTTTRHNLATGFCQKLTHGIVHSAIITQGTLWEPSKLYHYSAKYILHLKRKFYINSSLFFSY